MPGTGASATEVMPGTGMTMENSANGQPLLLKVSDQNVANGTVKIDEVISHGPGWVVVYTTGSNGQPDQPIGHAAVKDGDNTNVIVPVEPDKARGVLYALLHADLGTTGVFEYPGPDAPVMSGVQMIEGSFNAGGEAAAPTATSVASMANSSESNGNSSSNSNNGNMDMGAAMGATPEGATPSGVTPNIIVSNQPIVNGKVTVPEVISNGDAWLVIHKILADGVVGPMAGYAHVQDGDNRNVVVPLDPSLTSTTMSAMLHSNISKASTPQFPGVDTPISVNGQMLNPTFQITQDNTADVVVALGNTPDTLSYLVDGIGMSLYISLQDTPGKSNCTKDCLKTWNPLLATGRIVPGVGVPANKLGVLLLPNGSRQVTFSGAPLYRYIQDEKPGDVDGQGLDGNWYLVTP